MSGGGSRTRVLHVYAGNLYGGIEKLLSTLASQRNHCPGMEPVFALCFEGRLADELRSASARVEILGKVRLSRPWTTWLARRRLKTLLHASPGFDVVVTHACWVHAAFASTVRAAGIPLCFWAHDAFSTLGRIDLIAARTKPDRVIANSRYTLDTVPLIFPGVPGEVLYCPVPPPPTMDRVALRREVRQALDCDDQTCVIFMAARLERWKGHTLLLEALSHLTHKNWQAWIAGGPQRPHEEQYYSELQATARQLGVGEQVRWLGQRKDVSHLLAAADIHCQPNTGPEPFGIGFIEALQAGLPVVTTRLGAAPEIVDDTCGILTAPGDARSLAQSLDKLAVSVARNAFTGGSARATALCDPAQQLRLLLDMLCQSSTNS